eukprot:403377199
MGLCISKPMNNQQPFQKDVKAQRALLAKILEYDLNLNKQPSLSIAKRLCRENTNDLGDNLTITMSDIKYLELKKYFFICAYEIKSSDPLKYMYTFNDKQYYRCPFPCPKYLERSLDLFIIYTDHYEKFCTDIFGHWMDKYSPITNQNLEAIYSDYNSMMKLKDEIDVKLLYTFGNLWPRYQDFEHFKMEYDNQDVKWISMKCRQEIKQLIKTESAEIAGKYEMINYQPSEFIKLHSGSLVSKITKLLEIQIQETRDRNLTLHQEDQNPDLYAKNISDSVIIPDTFPPKATLYNLSVSWERQQEILQNLNNLEFQGLFIKKLMNTYFLSKDLALRYIKEYKSFLMLASVSLKQVTPSEQVDYVWHMHQSFCTKQYREDCFQVFGRLLKHCPTMGTQQDLKRFDDQYTQTLQYYKDFFEIQPDPLVWETFENRFKCDLFTYSLLDLRKLTNLTLYFEQKDFSQQKDPIQNISNSDFTKIKRESERYSHYKMSSNNQIVFKSEVNGRNYVHRKNLPNKRRENYIQNKRRLRAEIKTEMNYDNRYKEFDILKINGGPVILPNAFDYKYFDIDYDLESQILEGFYEGFKLQDIQEVKEKCHQFGAQEVMERLVDLGMGNFDVLSVSDIAGKRTIEHIPKEEIYKLYGLSNPLSIEVNAGGLQI